MFDHARIKPLHVATNVEGLQKTLQAYSKATSSCAADVVRLAGGRPYYRGQSGNAVRGPKQNMKKGRTPVLMADEARILLDSIDTSTVMGLRDRALIALMATLSHVWERPLQ